MKFKTSPWSQFYFEDRAFKLNFTCQFCSQVPLVAEYDRLWNTCFQFLYLFHRPICCLIEKKSPKLFNGRWVNLVFSTNVTRDWLSASGEQSMSGIELHQILRRSTLLLLLVVEWVSSSSVNTWHRGDSWNTSCGVICSLFHVKWFLIRLVWFERMLGHKGLC